MAREKRALPPRKAKNEAKQKIAKTTATLNDSVEFNFDWEYEKYFPVYSAFNDAADDEDDFTRLASSAADLPLSFDDIEPLFDLSLPTPVSDFPFDKEETLEEQYFSILERLRYLCHHEEQATVINENAIKPIARHLLNSIDYTLEKISNPYVLNVFKKLATLIQEHLLAPQKLKRKHLARFLRQLTFEEMELLNDYQTSLPDEEIDPIIESFSKLNLNGNATSNDSETPELKHVRTSSAETLISAEKSSHDESESSPNASPLRSSTEQESKPEPVAPKMEFFTKVPTLPKKYSSRKRERQSVKTADQDAQNTKKAAAFTVPEGVDDAKLARSLSLGLRTRTK